MLVTSDYQISSVPPPSLPTPPLEYDSRYVQQFNNVLRLYFNRLNSVLGNLTAQDITTGFRVPFGAFHQDGHTTLTANIGNGTTTPIPVVSTADFLPAGSLIIENEIISYTGKTSTTFTGITRGVYGTTSSAHTSGTAISEAQAVLSPSTALAIAFTVTDTSNQISIDPTNKSRIVFSVAGYYNIQFSTQLLNYTTSDDNVGMWFRKDGVDIANTTGIVTVPSKHGTSPGATITSWNLVVDVNAGQYIELMMTSDSGNTVAATYPPGIAPVHPASPSVILTATFVSAL